MKSVKFKTMVDACVSKSAKIFPKYSVSKNQPICSLPHCTVPRLLNSVNSRQKMRQIHIFKTRIAAAILELAAALFPSLTRGAQYGVFT